MRLLQSPFHSPPGSSGDAWTQVEDCANINLSPPLAHVSLSQIELNRPTDFDTINSSTELAFDCEKPVLGRIHSSPRLLNFSIDTTGRAILATALDPPLTASPLPSAADYNGLRDAEPHWQPEDVDLDLSSSPDRTNEHLVAGMKRTLAQVLSSPPKPTGLQRKACKRANLSAARSSEPAKQLSRSVSRKVAQDELKDWQSSGGSTHDERYIKDSEIASDFEQPIAKNIQGSTNLMLSSHKQLQKAVTRVLKRAKREDISDSQLDLQPVLRPRNSITVRGEATRLSALRIALKDRKNLRIRGKLRCHACQELFSSYEAYANHLDLKHKLSERAYECPVDNCPWSVLGFLNLQDCCRHISSSHQDRRLVCEICELQNKSRVFGRTDALRRHLMDRHSTIKSGKLASSTKVFLATEAMASSPEAPAVLTHSPPKQG